VGTRELIPERTTGGLHRNTGGCAQEEPIVRSHDISPSHEDSSRFVDPSLRGAVFDQLQQFVLQALEIAGGVFIEDDEVECEPLQAQVLVSPQDLGNKRYTGTFRDANENDRKVAGDAELPQVALAAAVFRDRFDVAQPGVAGDQAPAEALEGDGVVDRQAHVPQLDLAVGAGECDRTSHGAPVVVLLDQLEGAFLGVGESGREGHTSGGTRRQANWMPQADDRIEHGAGGVRQRSRACHGERTIHRSAASDEPGAIGLELRRRGAAAAATQDMNEIRTIFS
jgi:hypothetical protein